MTITSPTLVYIVKAPEGEVQFEGTSNDFIGNIGGNGSTEGVRHWAERRGFQLVMRVEDRPSKAS